DDGVGVEHVGGGEVVHLAAAATGAAQLDRDVLGADVAKGQPPTGAGSADRDPATGGADHPVRAVAADIREVGGPVENGLSSRQGEVAIPARHRHRAGQRDHQDLVVAR